MKLKAKGTGTSRFDYYNLLYHQVHPRNKQFNPLCAVRTHRRRPRASPQNEP